MRPERLPDEVILAIHNVAAEVAYHAVSDYLEHGWEDYPEIGEHDWQQVADEAIGMVSMQQPTTAEYNAAYDLLTARAEGQAS